VKTALYVVKDAVAVMLNLLHSLSISSDCHLAVYALTGETDGFDGQEEIRDYRICYPIYEYSTTDFLKDTETNQNKG
jgi:hypothetical protein